MRGCGKLPQLAAVALWCGIASTARADLDVPAAQLEKQLEAGWRALHPREAAPARCRHADPVRALTADLDGSPGAETAIASLRWGVVLFAADGKPLATMKLECGTPNDSETFGGVPQVLSLSAMEASGMVPKDLVVRRREIAHCGRADYFTLLARKGSRLFPLVRVEEDYSGYCGGTPPEKRHGSVELIERGVVRINQFGRESQLRLAEDGKWRGR